MDPADIASKEEAAFLADAHARHFHAKSARPLKARSHCRECDEPISRDRQLAEPGAQLCVECKTDEEERGRHRR